MTTPPPSSQSCPRALCLSSAPSPQPRSESAAERHQLRDGSRLARLRLLRQQPAEPQGRLPARQVHGRRHAVGEEPIRRELGSQSCRSEWRFCCCQATGTPFHLDVFFRSSSRRLTDRSNSERFWKVAEGLSSAAGSARGRHRRSPSTRGVQQTSASEPESGDLGAVRLLILASVFDLTQMFPVAAGDDVITPGPTRK